MKILKIVLDGAYKEEIEQAGLLGNILLNLLL